MPDDDHSQPASPGQAFGGLRDHVDGYKSYLEKLRKGASSGISGIFGLAKELLPEEHLNEYVYGGRRLDLGKSMLKEGAPQGVLRGALEQTIQAFHKEAETAAESATDGELAIIGEFVENGQRHFIFSDFTTSEASLVPPSMPATLEVDPLADALADAGAGIAEGEGEADGDAAASPAAADKIPDRLMQELFDSKPASQPEPVSPPVSVSNEPTPADSRPAPTTEKTVRKSSERPPVLAPDEQQWAGAADLSVQAADGQWLWDIFLDGESVSEVRIYDGKRILKTDNPELYVMVPPVVAGARAEATVISPPLCDRQTGNLFFRSYEGDHAIALLNNGLRLDQYQTDDGDDLYFVTERTRAGQAAGNRMQVANLIFDQENSSISYESMDGGMVITARFRRLQN